jgi:hypothetical protein
LKTPEKPERQEDSNPFNTFILVHNKLLYVGVVPCFSLHGKAVPTLLSQFVCSGQRRRLSKKPMVMSSFQTVSILIWLGGKKVEE